ncbi:MAG TPA: hypothetical protein VF230_18805 [Acidimicrobiales bacterium]
MTSRKGNRAGRGRLSWDGRLCDPQGREYTREADDLDRDGARVLLGQRNVQVAISSGGRPLRWLAPGEREPMWRAEIAPNFHDEPGWRAPRDAPGQLPFHAELWRSGDESVLLLTDRD